MSLQNKSGFILVDKPLGFSSNALLQKVRYLLGKPKAGHTGSLDPLATGMLPIAINEATKFSRFLLDADKAYLAFIQLGLTTTTADAEGTIVTQNSVPELTDEKFKALTQHFQGPQTQIPPMFSALKKDGQPLYKLARLGQVVERAPRDITLHQLKIIDYSPQTQILRIEVVCSKGTYIRTLAEDIGVFLGCGAYLKGLRRLWVAPFSESLMVSLESVGQDCAFIPLETVLPKVLPSLEIDATYFKALYQGQEVKHDSSFFEWIGLFHEQQFIGIGQASGTILKAKRLVNLSSLR